MRTAIRNMPGPRRSGGFTLIELAVACIVVGVLSAVAYPSYTRYVLSSNRSAAKAILAEQATYMERYYTSKGKYTDATIQDAQSPKKGVAKYVIAFEATPEDNKFNIVATPQGTQANDECGTLSMDNRGATKSTGAGANCW